MSYWRITYKLAGSSKTAYARDFNETEGVLRFTDLDGRKRVVGAGTPYLVTECDELPGALREKVIDE